MSSNHTIKFFGADVTVNAAGLLCLNDIHKAAGGKPSLSPRHWLANKRTKRFLDKIDDPRITSSHGGDNKGTWASSQVAVEYSCWVSEAFYLRYLHCFIRIVEEGAEGAKKSASEARDETVNWFV